jgi:seryl-tRNA synthetase
VIDFRKLRDDPDYRAGMVLKGASESVIDEVLAVEAARRDTLNAVESKRAESNAASKEIGRSAPEERDAKKAAAKALKDELVELEEAYRAADETLAELALPLPNPAHASVPPGGEDDFRVETTFGQQTPAPPMDHAEIGEHLGIVDTERAVRMSGSRFAYILGDAVRVQFALVQYTMAKLMGHGFVPAIVPVLVREDMMVDAGFFPADRNQVYEMEKDELFLVGTAEVGLAGLHRSERLDAEQLPLRYVGYSSCFRREAGTYGKDTAGLFRLHQFDKVEMFVYSHPDTSWDELELLRSLEEEIFTELAIPHRVITVAAGDLGNAAAKKYDIEAWIPSQQAYREVTSCSNYTDYSARRMGTRVKDDEGTQFLHTLNGTACAIGRTLLAIFENHQLADGTISVPEVLRPFCGGLEAISRR